MLLRRNIYFLLPYLVFLLFGLWLNLQYSQKDILLFINGHYSTFADTFFSLYTNVGHGAFFIFIIVVTAFFKFRYALAGLLAWVIQGIAVQLLKHVVFPERTRPWDVLKQDKSLHLVHDFHPFLYNSFPSGHSATAFCLFTWLSIIMVNKRLGILFFFLAMIVIYSRIYLVQHFFIDTYFGSMIGCASAFMAALIFRIGGEKQ